MAVYSFPAVFEKESEGGYSIFFPDVDGCYTQSEDIKEGMENASDALCLMLYELEKQGKAIPLPSCIDEIASSEGNFVALIDCDTRYYANYFNAKPLAVPLQSSIA